MIADTVERRVERRHHWTKVAQAWLQTECVTRHLRLDSSLAQAIADKLADSDHTTEQSVDRAEHAAARARGLSDECGAQLVQLRDGIKTLVRAERGLCCWWCSLKSWWRRRRSEPMLSEGLVKYVTPPDIMCRSATQPVEPMSEYDRKFFQGEAKPGGLDS